MKLLIWIVFGVFAALWTGAALAAVGVTQWVADQIASGAAVDLAGVAVQWPVPAWLLPWLDVATVQAVQQSVVALLEWLRDNWPRVGALLGWLVPVIWVVWALGLGVMLLLAGAGHWLVGRARPQPQPA
ncbi:MAG: hypothetical protein QM722_07195 [Piscinibacter sp.]